MKRSDSKQEYPKNLVEEILDISENLIVDENGLKQAVSSLTEPMQRALELRFKTKLTFAQGGKAMNVSTETFKELIESALRYLREPQRIETILYGEMPVGEEGSTFAASRDTKKGDIIRGLQNPELAKFLHTICPECSLRRWENWLDCVG